MRTLRLFAHRPNLDPSHDRLVSLRPRHSVASRPLHPSITPSAEGAAGTCTDRKRGVEQPHRGRFGRTVTGSRRIGRTATLFRDRDEEEVRGYGMPWSGSIETPPASTHRGYHPAFACYDARQSWDAGQYKHKTAILSSAMRWQRASPFHTVPAQETATAMALLVADWRRCLEERWTPSLLALAAFNLDFLCIHPFRDGNGRVSRLLWLLQSYHLGYEVGRYISLERIIEQHKDRYYETLEQSSQGWHEGKHDPWPYLTSSCPVMKEAYQEFAERVGEIKAPRRRTAGPSAEGHRTSCRPSPKRVHH